jgi:hypothetical protein
MHIKKTLTIQKFKKFKIFFKISKFQKSFTTCKWGIMYMTYKTKEDLDLDKDHMSSMHNVQPKNKIQMKEQVNTMLHSHLINNNKKHIKL